MAVGHRGAGDRHSRGRVKVRLWAQPPGEHPQGETQPGDPVPMLTASGTAKWLLMSCSIRAPCPGSSALGMTVLPAMRAHSPLPRHRGGWARGTRGEGLL